MRMPPRSWHCRICECCTLKRDHHCVFLASCIGHNNQRYFICLMAHFSLATAVCFAYSPSPMMVASGHH
ncbi:uncharacterized protein Dwil_GK27252 [Drosophila willistoni]|uniref:Palmitoyltransferase n=1 Tax=Drosophila willistoni TaxID=7260 RepID=A0A0Q9X603_DROWI|nr:uncharacterized protein Dwil_GK27252 [Drosophila willistoni]